MPVAVSKATISAQECKHANTSRLLLDGRDYMVHRPSSVPRIATILETRSDTKGRLEAYVSFVGQDKRLDCWVKAEDIGDLVEGVHGVEGLTPLEIGKSDESWSDVGNRSGPSRQHERSPSLPSTPEREHATITRVRNYEDVRVGEYLIKTWYYSPYPKTSEEREKERDGSPVPIIGKKRKLANGLAQVAPNENVKYDTEEENGLLMSKAPGGAAVKRTKANGVNGQLQSGTEMTRGRLWVCDLCFKYMRTRAGWDKHSSHCSMLLPPGRRVYQKGSYSIWEIDGAQSPLYCQNLSLFGKLFIDHKSVFFHVENFLFYVLCDAATSKRDQVMAFFSKEKISYDDHNLACIITFPPHQGKGFGKLLIEFSYYLTLHPATRNPSLSPGTPERPLSDLGLKGYTAYWTSVILRFCRSLLKDAPIAQQVLKTSLNSTTKPGSEGRTLRDRKFNTLSNGVALSSEHWNTINGVDIFRCTNNHDGQYSIRLSLAQIAKACHLRIDDTAMSLADLGFLRQRRHLSTHQRRTHEEFYGDTNEKDISKTPEDAIEGEWDAVEIVISREAVERQWAKWKVRDTGVLDVSCVLL